MKFSKFFNFILFILFSVVHLSPLKAEGGDDFMRSTGKINVVVAVIAVLFLGIVAYLIHIDRKLVKLERDIQDK
jgi:exosortase/archaeosortase